MPSVGKIEEDGKRENIGNALKSTFFGRARKHGMHAYKIRNLEVAGSIPVISTGRKPCIFKVSGFFYVWNLYESCVENTICMLVVYQMIIPALQSQ